MALVPFLRTALADEDANGTDGKNIVAGATVSVFDAFTGGSAIVLYDDEAGSNPSTAKVTGTDGQLSFYTTPGDYWVSINGSARKPVTIGGKGATYGDYDDIAALRPVNDGAFFYITDRANAPIKLMPSGYVALPGDVTFANGRVGALQVDGWANVKWFGAIGDGVTDDYQPIQDALDRYSKTVFPAGTYLVNTGLVKTGQFWTIEGQGPQQTIITGGASVDDIITLDIAGTIISRSTIKDLMIDTSQANKTTGAHIAASKNLQGVRFQNIHLRKFYDGFALSGGISKSFFDGITYDQFGRTSLTNGRHAWNFDGGEAVDVHFEQINGSGYGDAVDEHAIESHVYATKCDGLYFSNCHWFYGDATFLFAPQSGDVCASVKVSADCYFDTIRVNHVQIAGAAGAVVKSFNFNGPTFRDSKSDSIIVLNNAEIFTFTGCNFRDNAGTAILATDPALFLDELNVTGCVFDNNNTDNNTVAGDIISRGKGATITGNTFKNGGVDGHCVRFLSSSEDNVATVNNAKRSNCTAQFQDGGTNNVITGNFI